MKHFIKQSIRLSIATLILLLPAACQRTNPQTEALFRQAESLITEKPDSALHLLKALPATTGFTRRETARYALLLARATNKSRKSLLPCDSLLNVALDYYDNNEYERAVALLYKGRPEMEMEQNEKAIDHLQQSLKILLQFPQETETQMLVTNSLGNLYMKESYYQEAFKMHQEFYNRCQTNEDKFTAVNNISRYYLATHQPDSFLILQQEAQKYAYQTNDSGLIAKSYFNLSVSYSGNEHSDSAIYYAKQAIHYLPTWKKEKRNNYYGNLGDLLAEKGKLEEAAYYLNESLKDTTDMARLTVTLLSLYEIEKEKGNYRSALGHLERHVDIIDSLSYAECSTETQRLINAHHTQMKVYEEQMRKEKQISAIIIVSIILIFLITLAFQLYIQKKKKLLLLNQQALQETKNKIAFLQTAIQEEQSNIVFLKKEKDELKHKQHHWIEKIAEKEQHILDLKSKSCICKISSLPKLPFTRK